MYIDGSDNFIDLAFDGPNQQFAINGRERFNGKDVGILLNGMIHIIKIDGPAPHDCIDKKSQIDLEEGKTDMYIDDTVEPINLSTTFHS